MPNLADQRLSLLLYPRVPGTTIAYYVSVPSAQVAAVHILRVILVHTSMSLVTKSGITDRLQVVGLLMSATHVCEVEEDVSKPFASRRAVVRDAESGLALVGFPPDTQLNTQWRAIPRKMTGMKDRYKEEHELTVHQPKSSGPTSHEKTKLMFMSMSMSMSMSMLMSSPMSMT